MARQWIGPFGETVDEDGTDTFSQPIAGVLTQTQPAAGGVTVGPAQPSSLVAVALPPGIRLGSLVVGAGGISVAAFAGAASAVLRSLVLIPSFSLGSRALGLAPGVVLGSLTLSGLSGAARSALGLGATLLGSVSPTVGGASVRTDTFISPPPNASAGLSAGARTMLRMAGGKKG